MIKIKYFLICILGVLILGAILGVRFKNIQIVNVYEKIRTLSQDSSEIVVYRNNGGATTDFGIVVRYEKPFLPGMLIKRDLFSLYHVEDVILNFDSPDTINIDSIIFTSPQYRSDYMKNDPEIIEGKKIKIY